MFFLAFSTILVIDLPRVSEQMEIYIQYTL